MRIMNQRVASFAMVSLWIVGSGLPMLAQQAKVPEFPSPAEATRRLFQLVESNDEQAIAMLLGGPTELTNSGDSGQDKADRELFVEKYQEMHRLGHEADGSVTLYIGVENWPFPVPLVNQGGTWHFDPETGKKEILLRQIGENELIAIMNCEKFAAAENLYVAEPGDAGTNVATSMAARAARGSASGDPVLLNGYYFRLVPVQSANGQSASPIALIAYPAEYRSSGVMTFAVTKRGVVYEKDFGANTTALAGAMAAFHKDPTWREADK